MSTHRPTLLRGAFTTLASLTLGAMALAATPKPAPDAISAKYEKERAVCMTGQSNQDRATCLQEAGAARDEARRGGLDDAGARYRRNARERCDALPGDDRSACIARMKGAGTVSGTAASGGIVRELVTVEPAASAPK